VRAPRAVATFAALAALAALAGCASVPEDDVLLASTPIVRALDRETDDVVPVARFSALSPGDPVPADWMMWGANSGKRPTRYRLVGGERGTALEAYAELGATGLHRHIRVDPRRQPILEWSWRVESLIPDADPQYARRDDSAARMVISFHGDPGKLDFEQRAKLRLVKAITGDRLPYAILMYVWANALPVETIVPSPHFDRIRFLVVESGAAQLGQWVSYRRNVLEDYRRAFGEAPGDIVSVGVLTDSDNTKHVAHGWYGDITLRAR
jgi:hypothetical protein